MSHFFSSRGPQEQLIQEEHCIRIIQLYLQFRQHILESNSKDVNGMSEFILNSNGVAMRPGKAFCAATEKLLGKSISQGVFRKIFETGAHEAGLADGDRKLYAEHALHSLQVAESYYVTKDVRKTVCQ
jgi:hypothetical protein